MNKTKYPGCRFYGTKQSPPEIGSQFDSSVLYVFVEIRRFDHVRFVHEERPIVKIAQRFYSQRTHARVPSSVCTTTISRVGACTTTRALAVIIFVVQTRRRREFEGHRRRHSLRERF